MNNTSRVRSAPMKKLILISAALLAGAALSGCGVATAPTAAAPSAPVTVHGCTLQGLAKGGQQPVENAAVQLWLVSSRNYGAASTPLINGIAASTSNGSHTGGNA